MLTLLMMTAESVVKTSSFKNYCSLFFPLKLFSSHIHCIPKSNAWFGIRVKLYALGNNIFRSKESDVLGEEKIWRY